jgi:hypothetical protein
MGMLVTKIFTPTVPLRTWALLSSTMMGCMALGYFWTTVTRMPFSGNLNELSSRSLMGAAILPTMIFLLYCSWVYLEVINNPKTLRGVRNLTGPQARLSNRNFVVLVSTVLLVLGIVSLLFKIGSDSNSKHPAPPTVEVRKVGSVLSENKEMDSVDEPTQFIAFTFRRELRSGAITKTRTAISSLTVRTPLHIHLSAQWSTPCMFPMRLGDRMRYWNSRSMCVELTMICKIDS